MQMNITNQYKINIYEKWLLIKDIYNQSKDNKIISKLFEYYTCIKLTEEYKKVFYEYSDIDPDFREENKMSQTDTGIDCSDLSDTIVQCKLRSGSLNWRELGTFFGSQVIWDDVKKEKVIRWKNTIIARNSDSKLSSNLASKSNLFVDKTYGLNDFVQYCDNLIINPPEYPLIQKIDYKLRDYQIECIDKIKKSTSNLIINLPTGTGKNFIIINSLEPKKKYLILVPRIILMEQILDEIIKIKPELSKQIQFIGDGDNIFNKQKDITICVYNSIGQINSFDFFNKIFVDEAHHISKPEIYSNDDDYSDVSDYSDLDEYSDDEDDEDLEEDSDLDDMSIDDSENIKTEDEVDDKSNYIKIIRGLNKLNNNIYMSATIDEQEGFAYYKKDIRDMIEQGYLSDYTIHIPIFGEDPENIHICWHLIKNYSHIIIYCNSQKEGLKINNLLNQLVKGCCEYIDCKTPKKSRNKILDKFKAGKLLFLVNVKILVEGFDAPITKGVCFMHLPSSKTTLVQIIGRALRLHPEKKIANIILPCSTKEDESNISNFMKVMAQTDSRIGKSYQNKKLGGYVCFDLNGNEDVNKNIDIIESRYEMVYDSMGILKNNVEIWMKKLEEVKKYIDENDKRPSKENTNKYTKKMGRWISEQIQNYKNKDYIMRQEFIYKLWEDFINDNKYKKYFENNLTEWINRFNELKNYIEINNKRPNKRDKDNNIKKLSSWLSTQIQSYKNKDKIMKNNEIYKLWEDFINDEKYVLYFNNNTKWINIFNEVIKYLDNNKLSVFNKKELNGWIHRQNKNYKNKEQIMKDKQIYKLWEDFINSDKYIKNFQDNNNIWINNLKKVKKYIDENNKRPSLKNYKDIEIKYLGQWISYQQKNYKNKKNIMKDEEIKKLWEDFINDIQYKKYFEEKIKINKSTKHLNKTNNEIEDLEKELFG